MVKMKGATKDWGRIGVTMSVSGIRNGEYKRGSNRLGNTDSACECECECEFWCECEMCTMSVKNVVEVKVRRLK